MTLADRFRGETAAPRPGVTARHDGIPRGTEVGDFAPYRGRKKCQSRAGRWRPKHEYVRGVCIYCNFVWPNWETSL